MVSLVLRSIRLHMSRLHRNLHSRAVCSSCNVAILGFHGFKVFVCKCALGGESIFEFSRGLAIGHSGKIFLVKFWRFGVDFVVFLFSSNFI